VHSVLITVPIAILTECPKSKINHQDQGQVIVGLLGTAAACLLFSPPTRPDTSSSEGIEKEAKNGTKDNEIFYFSIQWPLRIRIHCWCCPTIVGALDTNDAKLIGRTMDWLLVVVLPTPTQASAFSFQETMYHIPRRFRRNNQAGRKV
jgi:hypothetical protein